VSKRLRTGLIVLISAVWAANFIMPLIRSEYKPPAEINVAFMTVVGLLSAGYRGNGDGDRGQYTQQYRLPPPGWDPYMPQTPEPPAPDPPRKRPAAKTAPKKKVAKKSPAKKAGKKTAAKKRPAKKTTAKRTVRKRQ
jgi:hypothetical protein